MVRQQELQRLQRLRGHLPAQGLEIGDTVLVGEELGRRRLLRRSAAQEEDRRSDDQPQENGDEHGLLFGKTGSENQHDTSLLLVSYSFFQEIMIK